MGAPPGGATDVIARETGGTEPKQSFALADAAQAQRAPESRKTTGATVLGAMSATTQQPRFQCTRTR